MDITEILERWSRGDEQALDQLAPLVHEELYAIAKGYMKRERSNHSFSGTDLVSEAYVKFCGMTPKLVDRAHFYTFAACIMRRCLIDHVRNRQANKRKDELSKIIINNLDTRLLPGYQNQIQNLDLSLSALKKWDTRKAAVIELSYFVGMTVVEIAEVLTISSATVKRDLILARAWMGRFLDGVAT